MMRRIAAGTTIILAVAGFLLAGAGGVRAQVEEPVLPPMEATSTTAGEPATTTTSPLEPVAPSPVPAPPPGAPAPKPKPADPPAQPNLPPIPGDGGGEGVVPPAGVGPFPEHLAALSRSVKRSGPRNTRALMEGLRQLTDLGMSQEEAMRVGMGRFPVAGYAHYSHDWWFPRFGPDWRLHLGTDLFADQGTPLRSPTEGVVRLSNGGLGGLSTYVVQPDGTYFYMAHLAGWPEGLRDGQSVAVGDIVGYVGSSGNAAGGSPHLHFEVHPAVKVVTVGKGKRQTTKIVPAPVRPGTVLPAADPKALLDAYLDEAMQNLDAVVAAYKAANPPPPPSAAEESVDPALVAPSLGLAARKGLLLSETQPAVSVPLLGLAALLVLMVACLTPVLGTTASLPSSRRGRQRRLLEGPPAGDTAAGDAPVELAPPGANGTRRHRLRRSARRAAGSDAAPGGPDAPRQDDAPSTEARAPGPLRPT
ncbi:MAG: M23 family metallopeptidase [Actinobacteria bacterium]|nr:M23 family metallopeptidase [Actinomycetota bacterium]